MDESTKIDMNDTIEGQRLIGTTDRLGEIHSRLLETYEIHGGINHVDGTNLPSSAEVIDIIRKLMYILFPGFFGGERVHGGNLKNWTGYILDSIFHRLKRQIARSVCFSWGGDDHENHACEAEKITLEVLEKIPKIRELLKKDVQAAFSGDPAANSHEEVITSYPSIQAIALYRIAHELYVRDVPLIPRMITEYAHKQTGIDIHPGATIGEHFFIDHGTGVVIGETCTIGNNVKIYHLVTLGALSFKKDDGGRLIKGLKRHPTIEDEVILYAGCTILGGHTVIGKGSVIGGNVWVTESLGPNTVITFDVEQQVYRKSSKGIDAIPDTYVGHGI